jgi:hypothetical protein
VFYSSTFACVFLDGTSFTFGTMDINFNVNQQLRKVLEMWIGGEISVLLWNRPPKNLSLLTGITGETFLGGTGLFQSTFTIRPSFVVHQWEMNVMMNLNMYRLQAMSTYTYSLRVGGKWFLRACLVAVIEWHVRYILDEVVKYCGT